MLAWLDSCMKRGEITIHSEPGLVEMMSYVWLDDGSIGPGVFRDMLSGAKEAHGDRVIAYGLANFARREVHAFDPPAKEYARGTLGEIAGLNEDEDDEGGDGQKDWDDF